MGIVFLVDAVRRVGLAPVDAEALGVVPRFERPANIAERLGTLWPLGQ